MSGRLMNLFFRPGWRLRCIDPPIAWVRLDPPTVEIRVQLTCYLTSRYAGSVRVRELQLRLRSGSEECVAPWVRSTDAGDEPLGETLEYAVSGDAPHHAFIDFAIDSSSLSDQMQTIGDSIPAEVEAILKDAIEFRKIADLELGRLVMVTSTLDWQRVGTGRELDLPDQR